jgi:adenylate cyclase
MPRFAKTAIFSLLVGLAGLIACAVFSHFGLEEKAGLYLLFKVRGVREAPEEVAVVAMDRRSVRELNLARETHKWPRDLHGRLIEALSTDSPGVIAFDVIFDEAKDSSQDEAFAAAMASAGNVVLCEYVEKETLAVGGAAVSMEKRSRPIDLFADSSVGSGPFPLPKRPVRVGQVWLFKSGGEEIPTLPVVAFQTWALPAYDAFRWAMTEVRPKMADDLPASREEVLAEGVDRFAARMRILFYNTQGLGDVMASALEASSFSSEEKSTALSLVNLYSGPDSRYVSFYGPSGSVSTVSYSDVLASADGSDAGGVIGGGEGKAVFVGLSDTQQVQEDDVFFTVFSQENGIDLSGVEIAATTFANLLTDGWVTPLGDTVSLLVIFFMGCVLGIISFLFRPSRSIPAVLLVGVAYLLSAQLAFGRWGLWCPIVTPLFFQIPAVLLAALLIRYAQVKRERRRIRTAFGRYLPEKVVNRLASDFHGQGHEDQLVYGVCLFSDAQQYTSLAEEMDPAALRELMNRYYGIAFKPVTDRGGFISDVVGDAMLAIWTAREPDPAMAVSACRAALEIADGVARFKDAQGTAYLPTRMGIHAGYVSIGDVGAGGHFEYRAVGDIVNTASRIEGLNKELGTTILVSSEVCSQIEGFTLRPKGEFMLKGKSVPVSVSELVSWDGR